MSVERCQAILDLLSGFGAAPGEERGRNFDCGGALLFLSRKEAMGVSHKIPFDVDPEAWLPEEGRGSIRVRCRGRIAIRQEKTGEVVVHALCDRCLGWEQGNRTKLRNDQQEADKPAEVKRRGFKERAGGAR